MRTFVAILASVIALTACSGISDEDRSTAEDFCAGEGEFGWEGGMGLSEYDDPEGFDRCVEDAAKVADCLDETIYTDSFEPALPESCD